MNRHPSLPTSVRIMGITYSIKYHDKPSDVDVFKRESLWGQIDFWTRTINIYYRHEDHALDSIWQVILHEVMHGIAVHLHLEELNESEEAIDLLSLGLMNVEFQNEEGSCPKTVIDLCYDEKEPYVSPVKAWDNPNVSDDNLSELS